MLRTACCAIALFCLPNPAFAQGCATPGEAAALKMAMMQQEMMVAALQCRETGAYNRFVITHRGELQSLDASVKAFFARHGGEGYDGFKTRAANLAALRQAQNMGAFCAGADALFQAARNHPGSLVSFAETRPATGLGDICIETASAQPLVSPAKPQAMPVLVAIPPAQPRPVEIAASGVPVHSLPAIPYGVATPQGKASSIAPPPVTMARESGGAPFMAPTDTKARPAEVAMNGVPDHRPPAMPYQDVDRSRITPPPQTSLETSRPEPVQEAEPVQDEEDQTRGSNARTGRQFALAPSDGMRGYRSYDQRGYRFYDQRDYGERGYRFHDQRDYGERAYREPAYYPPPRRAIPYSYWQRQAWRAWREPRYAPYPRYTYRGW